MQILLKEMLFCWGEDIMKVIFNLYFFLQHFNFFYFLIVKLRNLRIPNIFLELYCFKVNNTPS